VSGLEPVFAVVGTEAAKAVATAAGTQAWKTLASPPRAPEDRTGYHAVQALVIVSAQESVSASAAILSEVDALELDSLVKDPTHLRTKVAELLSRGAEIRNVVAQAEPVLAGLRALPDRAVPQLDPETADRLTSVVTWHRWLLGALLDLAGEPSRADQSPSQNSDSDRPVYSSVTADVDALAKALLCIHCLSSARSSHRLLQTAASESLMKATGADRGAMRKAQEQVRRDAAWRRRLLARSLERFADGLDDVVSTPSMGTRLRRLIRNALTR
jgi:hypothetical protein